MVTQSLHLFNFLPFLKLPLCKDFSVKFCFSGLNHQFQLIPWRPLGKKKTLGVSVGRGERRGAWVISVLRVLLMVKYSGLFCFLPLVGYLIKFMTEDANQP